MIRRMKTMNRATVVARASRPCEPTHRAESPAALSVQRPLLLLAIALILSCAGFATSAESKAHLFIIGGGRQPAHMTKRFIELAGGTNHAKIIVLPMAGADPASSGARQVAEFKLQGAVQVESVVLTREEATNPRSAVRLDGATGIFFTGGDQTRLAAVLVDSPVHQKLKELYSRGAVIGGTSAGAAIMSQFMITGGESLNEDKTNSFPFIKQGNVQTATGLARIFHTFPTERRSVTGFADSKREKPVTDRRSTRLPIQSACEICGLGFMTNAVIDQHFLKRKRLPRRFSVVLEHPQLVGIGIDESTAIIVNPDDTFEVLGESSVLVIDPRTTANLHADPRGNLSASDILTHVLVAGDRFDLKRGKSRPPKSSGLFSRPEPSTQGP